MNQKLFLLTITLNSILALGSNFALAAGKNSRLSVNPPTNTSSSSSQDSTQASASSSGTTQTTDNDGTWKVIMKILANASGLRPTPRENPPRVDLFPPQRAVEIEQSCEGRYAGDECAIPYCECLEEAGLEPDDPILNVRPTTHGDNCGTSHFGEQLADQISAAQDCQDQRDECEQRQASN